MAWWAIFPGPPPQQDHSSSPESLAACSPCSTPRGPLSACGALRQASISRKSKGNLADPGSKYARVKIDQGPSLGSSIIYCN